MISISTQPITIVSKFSSEASSVTESENNLKSPEVQNTHAVKVIRTENKIIQNPSNPTCQVRVVRFHVGSSLPRFLLLVASSSSSTATIRGQCCCVPDLNSDHSRPVFPAGPQPRSPATSVPCRTATARQKICQTEGQKLCQKMC